MSPADLEKLKQDRLFLIAVISDLAHALKRDGLIRAGDRTIFCIDEHDGEDMPTLAELLTAYVAEREGGKVPG